LVSKTLLHARHPLQNRFKLDLLFVSIQITTNVEILWWHLHIVVDDLWRRIIPMRAPLTASSFTAATSAPLTAFSFTAATSAAIAAPRALAMPSVPALSDGRL